MKKFVVVLVLCLVISFATDLVYSQENLIGYFIKQGFKQGGLLLRARRVDEVLKDEVLDPKTERYLKLSQKVIDFVAEDLGMTTGKNYRKYIALDRPWVTNIVIAAYQDRAESYLFHYPIMGYLPYKGYFDEEDAVEFEKSLKKKNLDTYRRHVEAYSTTGWLPDPLISTMFSSEARMIELLCHESTHSTFYFASEADFNEAFASWMGFQGALLFVDKNRNLFKDPNALFQELKDDHSYQLRFASIIKEVLAYANEFYKAPKAVEKRAELFKWIQNRFAKEKGFEKFAEKEWNNAYLTSLSTYYDQVPAIQAYADRHKLSPRDFLAMVKKTGPSIIAQIMREFREPDLKPDLQKDK
jgi:predicted aminopeptidase